MVSSKKVKVLGSDKITKIKKEAVKPEKVSWEGLPIKFLRITNRGGKSLEFHSAWLQQDDARKKKEELRVNGTEAVIVIHNKLKDRYFAIYEIVQKVGQ